MNDEILNDLGDVSEETQGDGNSDIEVPVGKERP
jgi:hypothetical protein